MLPGFDLVQFAQNAGVLAAIFAVAIIIFSESGLLIGFFLPGDSILFTLGFLLQGYNILPFGLNIHWIVLLLFIAAAAGDSVGYSIGYRAGPHVFNKPESLLFKRENINKAERFYKKYGGKAIVIARFVPIVRTFAPVVAGVGKMKYSHFVLFNILGAALWTGTIVYAGFFLGSWFTSMGIDIDIIVLPIAAFIIFLSVLPAVYHLLKTKEKRDALWQTTKTTAHKIKSKVTNHKKQRR